MTSSTQAPIAQLLDRFNAGDTEASERLLALFYEELHRLAGRYMRDQKPSHTLQATALVNEAYLRLCGEKRPACKDGQHYLALAARAMRSVLLDHARGRRRLKRTAPGVRVALEQVLVAYEEHSFDLVELDAVLERLARFDPKMARGVDLRFFGGLSVEQTAECLGMSKRTFERDWATTRAWILSQLGDAT